MSLISLQGKIWMAERSAQGKALKQTWVGNARPVNCSWPPKPPT
ncbi:hypothetical protein CSB95_5454 [Pseudomonas aeruginosa]|nr:hypothetical protein CSB95_5454 [Pseudomonas aeruginosa]